MSTAATMKRVPEASTRPRARITGVVYLLYFLTAVFAQLLVDRTSVAFSNAAALVATACYIALTVLLYFMFKPVNRRLSFVAAFLSLVGCAIQALSVFHLAPAHGQLLFFGFYCVLIGYLIFRSSFLPRILGVLMALAGVGWLLSLSPLARTLSTYIEAVGVVAEASLMLWLLVFGVNVQRWTE